MYFFKKVFITAITIVFITSLPISFMGCEQSKLVDEAIKAIEEKPTEVKKTEEKTSEELTEKTVTESTEKKQNKELPLLMDLAQINLEVKDAEVINEISSYDRTISAKGGYKLVAVTLEGNVNKPCRIAFNNFQFAAIYEEYSTKYKAEGEFIVHIKESSAIAKNNSWSLAPEGGIVTTTYYIYESGPIFLKVAFSLPEEIFSFYVLYPTLVKGEVTLH